MTLLLVSQTGALELYRSTRIRSIQSLTESQFQSIKSKVPSTNYVETQNDVGQEVTMLSYSGFVWDLTSRAKEDLSKNLNDLRYRMELEVSFSFTRKKPTETTLSTESYKYLLSNEERLELSKALNYSNNVDLHIPHLYPRMFRVTEASIIEIDGDEDKYINATLGYRCSGNGNNDDSSNSQCYWEVRIANDNDILIQNSLYFNNKIKNKEREKKKNRMKLYEIDDYNNDDEEENDEESNDIGLILYTASDKVLSGVISDILSMLGGAGLIALYTFILVVLGGNLRSLYSTYPWEILYNEMEEPKPLIDMCQGIYLSRCATYEDHLKDEFYITQSLINLYRSPDILLQITKARQT